VTLDFSGGFVLVGASLRSGNSGNEASLRAKEAGKNPRLPGQKF